ncbi:ADP-ribosylglycohydrolase family protein [Maribellus comscasis]|uniref:ADP-ribosylglycohydrolase family protein n=2 Tax=Maribellus comscasis TaxID=2681766 RepID=A0A6I6JZ48_9BACT|nr:ADP-ribosylglycohydrolase family protein [Maribellus comscasis]
MSARNSSGESSEIVMKKEVLMDKVKGAWAAQTIGVTFGIPVEFKFNTMMVPDYLKLDYNENSLINEYTHTPGTYDDIYMDLTFVDVIEKEGIDAPAQSFADAFTYADYKLWNANQMGRYNIMNGLKPPASGHWLNNPCADDIDFQIEADFAGIMAPGMINSAVEICDKVGHIMNYGDGYYGGVFVAGLYSMAMVSNDTKDIKNIVQKALSVIPPESQFAQCIQDVILSYEENPHDWKLAWFKVSRKWSEDIGNPIGVFKPFNIDAKINAAWVVIGLLFGEGDFTKTFEIATRCGDDADCNPATAGGILGAITGFKNIPDYWKQGLDKVENIPFYGTEISLSKAYQLSYKHAEQMIVRNGGNITENELIIKTQGPVEIPLEVSFKGHYPTQSIIPSKVGNNIEFEFEGIGFVLAAPPNGVNYEENYVFEIELYINGKLVEEAKIPTEFNKRRYVLCWRYELPRTRHHVLIKIRNPSLKYEMPFRHAIVYDDKPNKLDFDFKK